MASFLGLVVLLAFSSFNGVSPRVIQGNIESLGVIGYHNENIIKQGEIFNGKDSLTLSEYTQSLEKVVGRKSNSDDVDKAKKDFEKMDKNGNGFLELQEMVDAMIEVRAFEYDQLHNFKLVDRNSDGFLDLTEIRQFPLRIIGIPLRDLEHLLKDRYPYLERPVESVDPTKINEFTEEEIENRLRHGHGVDLLGLDNQMDYKEYLRWGSLNPYDPTDRFYMYGSPTKSQNPTNLGQAGPTTKQCYSYKGTTKVYKPCPAGWK